MGVKALYFNSEGIQNTW